MSISAVMMVAALLTGDPDGVVATAPRTAVDLEATAQPTAPSVAGAAQAAVPHGLSTDQQIDRWIESRSVADAPWAQAPPRVVDDREMHGEVSVSIGTGGYRDYGAGVSLPVGDNGRLGLSYRKVENGYGYGGYRRYGYDDPWYDNGAYGYSGYRTGAASEGRVVRPEDPRREPLLLPGR